MSICPIQTVPCTESGNYKYALGQKQNINYFLNKCYYSEHMVVIYFQNLLITLKPSQAILLPPQGLPALRLWITDMENRKSITILHLWPSPSVFFLPFSSGTVWESRYACSWKHFPCGWYNLLPLHCVFLYGGLFPHWLAHTSVSGKWHVVWHGSKLHKWVYMHTHMKRGCRRASWLCGIHLKGHAAERCYAKCIFSSPSAALSDQ